MTKHQAGTEMDGDRRLYEVGRTLRFTGYDGDEIDPTTLGEPGFEPGDLLRVLPTNGCGMGIDVERTADGRRDMVWPTEVEVIE